MKTADSLLPLVAIAVALYGLHSFWNFFFKNILGIDVLQLLSSSLSPWSSLSSSSTLSVVLVVAAAAATVVVVEVVVVAAVAVAAEVVVVVAAAAGG